MQWTNSNGSPLAGGRGIGQGLAMGVRISLPITAGELVERLPNPTSIYCTLGHSIFNDHTVYLAKDALKNCIVHISYKELVLYRHGVPYTAPFAENGSELEYLST